MLTTKKILNNVYICNLFSSSILIYLILEKRLKYILNKV